MELLQSCAKPLKYIGTEKPMSPYPTPASLTYLCADFLFFLYIFSGKGARASAVMVLT